MGKLEPQFRVKRHSDGKVIVPTFLVDPNPDNGSLVTGIHFGLMPTSSSSPNMNLLWAKFGPGICPLVLDGQSGPSGTDFRFSFFVGAEVALPKPVPSASTENCDSTKPHCVSSPEPTNNGLPSGGVPALAPEIE